MSLRRSITLEGRCFRKTPILLLSQSLKGVCEISERCSWMSNILGDQWIVRPLLCKGFKTSKEKFLKPRRPKVKTLRRMSPMDSDTGSRHLWWRIQCPNGVWRLRVRSSLREQDFWRPCRFPFKGGSTLDLRRIKGLAWRPNPNLFLSSLLESRGEDSF